ncbi:MAG: hypothetical protein SFW65_00915 [Alphaproteobacteria bacterium]|nr:hypothetical protein [Alphaproteobacteria bacterium]
MGFWTDALDVVSFGAVSDWQKGNRLLAIAKGASAILLVAGTVMLATGAAPVIAGVAITGKMVLAASTAIGVGVAIREDLPEFIQNVRDGFNEVFNDQANPNGSQRKNDRTSELTPSSAPTSVAVSATASPSASLAAAPSSAPSYVAVDTTRLASIEQPADQTPSSTPSSAPTSAPRNQEVVAHAMPSKAPAAVSAVV